MAGIPSNLAWIPFRTCSLPTMRCPLGAGPRGVSKTQSSVKNDMIASTSWSLKASRSACNAEASVWVIGVRPALGEEWRRRLRAELQDRGPLGDRGRAAGLAEVLLDE